MHTYLVATVWAPYLITLYFPLNVTKNPVVGYLFIFVIIPPELLYVYHGVHTTTLVNPTDSCDPLVLCIRSYCFSKQWGEREQRQLWQVTTGRNISIALTELKRSDFEVLTRLSKNWCNPPRSRWEKILHRVKPIVSCTCHKVRNKMCFG